MPVQGASDEIDAFRAQVLRELPSANIVDSNYYGVDTFAMCEIKWFQSQGQDLDSQNPKVGAGKPALYLCLV